MRNKKLTQAQRIANLEKLASKNALKLNLLYKYLLPDETKEQKDEEE